MNNKRYICVAISLCCGVFAGATQAIPALEEVVVTAQKTEETIQSVPISIQALDSKVLENNAVNSFSDLKALVPALRFMPYPTAQENMLVNIRGIPAGAVELTQDMSTAVHINGVYIGRANGINSSVADLERIEVLRGPQGTLYGRNASAGAINLITVKPTDTFSFKQQVTLAEQDQRVSKTSINVPLTSELYAKVSYLYDQKEGFVDNSAPNGNDIGDRAAQGARFDLRWVPTSDLTVDYSYDWSDTRYYSTPGQCREAGTGSILSAAVDASQCSKSFLDKIAYYGHSPKNDVTADGHTLSVEWSFDDHKTLRSITAYRSIDDDYYGVLIAAGANVQAGAGDFNLPGLSLPAVSDHTKQHQFSQELQLVGDIGEQITYSTGLYYFKESGSEDQGYGGVLMARTPSLTIVSTSGPRNLDVTNESVAAFGQLTWTPTILDGNLDIIPGVRFTRDKREAEMFQRLGGAFLSLGGPFFPNNSGSNAITYIGTPDAPNSFTGTPAEFNKKFSKFTPSVTLQYRFTPDIMGYAKYVDGYRSGGTAVRASNTATFEQGFGPETLASYEFGLKSTWFDQRLRVNADVFQSKFSDQQVAVRNAAAALAGATVIPYDIVNAGKSTYQGGELEVEAAVTENLRLSANYAYLHFEYDSVEDPATGADVTQFYHNIVPTNSYSIAANYSLPDVGIGRLDANLNYSYIDSVGNGQDAYTVSSSGVATMTSALDRKQAITPSYGIWNGRLALSEIKVGPSDKGDLTVALWCKNIADLKYSASTYSTIQQIARYQSMWGEPRTFGVDFIYKYE